MSASGLRAAVAALALCAAGVAAQPTPVAPDLAAQKRLPINLEASSSQFDGQANELTFQQVVITQGPMSISAERGKAARLDFENTRWRFEGKVVLVNQGARIECEDAELLFDGYRLRSAVLRGEPVRLEQQRPGKTPTEGRAGLMEYDVAGAAVRLSGAAWLSDGANEFSGERISYDLAREYVTADSGGGTGIRMKIKPPRDGEEGEPAP